MNLPRVDHICADSNDLRIEIMKEYPEIEEKKDRALCTDFQKKCSTGYGKTRKGIRFQPVCTGHKETCTGQGRLFMGRGCPVQ